MNTRDDKPNKTYTTFRTSLDVGMGVLYIMVGALVLYARYFGTLPLSPTYAYVLGGILVLYGIFRIYRGLAAIFRMRKQSHSSRL